MSYGEPRLPQAAGRVCRQLVHLVGYGTFIKRQLGSRNLLEARVWCKFGHVKPRNPAQRKLRTPPSDVVFELSDDCTQVLGDRVSHTWIPKLTLDLEVA